MLLYYFLSLGIASGTKSNENPCLPEGVIVPLLLKLNQPLNLSHSDPANVHPPAAH